jgi:hypothetical protein
MTEPANVTTGSGAAADGDEPISRDEATTSGHGDPSASDRGGEGDADLVAEH